MFLPRKLGIIPTAAGVAMLWLPPPVDAQSIALADQFQVNTATTSYQYHSDVAVAADGSFVVVWNDRRIQASMQRFGADGVAIGGEVSAHETSPFILRDPAVDAAPGGAFVVAWAEYYNGQYKVYGRAFDAAGGALTGDFAVDSTSHGIGDEPEVAVGGNGSFVIVWDEYTGDIWGRRFASSGTAQGGAFAINSITTGNQNWSDVAADAEGDFVVTWRDVSAASISMRRFTSAGVASPETLVRTGMVDHPAVDMAASGEFVVVWREYGSAYEIGFFIYGQRFDSDGNALEAPFKVNTTGSGEDYPVVDLRDDGSFVVVWDSIEIDARDFAANGSPIGAEYQINTFTTSDQTEPRVDGTGGGHFVGSWTSVGSPEDDSDQESVQARRYELSLFADGFESGDLSAWSNSVP